MDETTRTPSNSEAKRSPFCATRGTSSSTSQTWSSLDSNVINAVCKARSVAADERRECVLVVTPDSAAWQVLELTGLVLKVPTFGSEADAVTALAGAAA
jgi:hypothetical protein